MTKAQFYAAVEAKPNFLKWANDEATVETYGVIHKNVRMALIETPDGRNTFPIWSIEDTSTGEVTFQNIDTLTPSENTDAKKEGAIVNYLKATFFAFFLIRSDLQNNWAEAEVFVDGAQLTRQKVLVYKKGAAQITHKVIIE